MTAQHLPALPSAVRASELLHGSDDDFIINAYLALQRHWPDDGGYWHYRYLLQERPAARADVLRTLAASDTARHIGAAFTDDLPPGHHYDPACESSPEAQAILRDSLLKLRLPQVVHDAQATRQALSGLSLEALSGAFQTLMAANRDTLAMLESRLAALESRLQQLQQARLERAAGEGDWMAAELLRLGARLQALEQVQATPPAHG